MTELNTSTQEKITGNKYPIIAVSKNKIEIERSLEKLMKTDNHCRSALKIHNSFIKKINYISLAIIFLSVLHIILYNTMIVNIFFIVSVCILHHIVSCSLKLKASFEESLASSRQLIFETRYELEYLSFETDTWESFWIDFEISDLESLMFTAKNKYYFYHGDAIYSLFVKFIIFLIYLMFLFYAIPIFLYLLF